MSVTLDVRDLRVSYDAIEALHGISFRVEAGALATLIGANGAGKTTAMNALCGLRSVRSGSITLGGAALDGQAPHERVRSGLSQVPEGRRLFGRMTVKENLWIGAYGRADTASSRTQYERVLALFPRVKERLGQLAGTLSGGEQQMVAIGRAMMSEPSFLLLDEPTMGLAPALIDIVLEAIAAINRSGVTILLVEQNAYRALEISDVAFVLDTGRIVLHGSGRDLLDHPGVRSAYLGYDE